MLWSYNHNAICIFDDDDVQTRRFQNAAWRPAKAHAKVHAELGVRTGWICSAFAIGRSIQTARYFN